MSENEIRKGYKISNTVINDFNKGKNIHIYATSYSIDTITSQTECNIAIHSIRVVYPTAYYTISDSGDYLKYVFHKK